MAEEAVAVVVVVASRVKVGPLANVVAGEQVARVVLPVKALRLPRHPQEQVRAARHVPPRARLRPAAVPLEQEDVVLGATCGSVADLAAAVSAPAAQVMAALNALRPHAPRPSPRSRLRPRRRSRKMRSAAAFPCEASDN